VRGQRFLDVFDRLLAEDGRQLALGLHDDIADRLDTNALQAVVRAQTELELLDREVFERFDRVVVERLCERQLVDHDLASLIHRLSSRRLRTSPRTTKPAEAGTPE
jgi:hypothetical protein